MKCPAEVYQPSPRPYTGLPDIHYPLHDKTIVVTRCGRICLGRKKLISARSLPVQAVGIMEVQDDIWLVSFMDLNHRPRPYQNYVRYAFRGRIDL